MTTNKSPVLLVLLTLFAVLAAVLAAAAAPAAGQVEIFSDDFESGDLSRWSSFAPVDAAPPTVTLLRPGDTATDILTPEVELAWLDGLSGVELASLVVVLDGETITESCAVEALRAICPTPPLSVGSHVLRVQLQDRAGNLVEEVFSFELNFTGGPRIAVLAADADTFLAANATNRPWGGLDILALAEDFPTLLRFGAGLPEVTENTVVVEARLFLTVEENLGGWAPGASAGLHRLNQPFSEEATTWNCAEDTEPEDNNIDCASPWFGGDFEPTPFATRFIDDSTAGEISFDVTEAAGALLDAGLPANGWALVASDGSGGQMSFFSRQAAAGQPRLELILDDDIDESTPEVVFLEPVDGEVLINTSPQVRVSLSDPDSPIAPDTFRLTSGLADLSGSCIVSLSEAVCRPPTLGEGIKTLRAEVFDEGGQRGSDSVAITVIFDEQAPTLRLLSPTRERVIAPSPPAFELSFDDTDSGIESASFLATVDGQPATGCVVTGADAVCPLDGLAEGEHSLVAQISDNIGLTSQVMIDFELLLDAVPPVITAVGPLAPVILPEPSVSVEVAWSDDDVGVVPVSLRVDVGGETQADECEISTVGAVCEVDLPEGTSDVLFTIEDQAGNLGSLSLPVTVAYDPDFPTLDVIAPLEGEIIDIATPTVELAFADVGAGLDAGGLELLVDGNVQTGACSSGADTASCALPALGAGDHTLLARVADLAGNVTERTVNFEVMLADTEAPVLSVLSPLPGLSQGFGAPPIEITWSDPSGLQLATASILVDGADGPLLPKVEVSSPEVFS